MIATGQSGHPLSRHWGDLVEPWRRGATLRLGRVAEEATGRILLFPSAPGAVPERIQRPRRATVAFRSVGLAESVVAEKAATPCFQSGLINRSCSPGRGSLSANT